MIIYVLKSSLCMLLLWGFYVLFLEKENMHTLKRWYLMFSLFFALSIPLVTFTYQTEVVDTAKTVAPIVGPQEAMVVNPMVEPTYSIVDWSLVLWSMYGIGVLIFGIRFTTHLWRLMREIRKNEQLQETSHINVLIPDTIIPHTFLNYIFVPKKEYQENNIPEEVLLHEKTHVTQKHTLDILCVEILQVLFWFNPVLIFIKKSIKLNHEFLADQTVLQRQFSLQNYMNLLVSYPNGLHQTGFSSSINYSLTKKRILMMSQQFSKKRAIARLLLFLPILLGSMLLFNNKIVAQQKSVNYTKTTDAIDPDKKIEIRIKGEQITVNGKATKLSGFANTVNQITKEWKENELQAAQFDIQVMNSDDQFLQKLNQAYKKTRLYSGNPEAHDLIPTTPPEPKIPTTDKAMTPLAPEAVPSPPSPPKAKKVPCNWSGKGKVTIKVPQPPSGTSSYSAEDLKQKIEEAMEVVDQEIEVVVVDQSVVEDQQIVLDTETIRREAMRAAEEARALAAIDIEKIHYQAAHGAHMAQRAMQQEREIALRNVERERHRAEERARVQAIKAREEAEIAREQAMKSAEKARRQAERAREKAYRARDKALKQAEKAHEEARKAAEKARRQAEEMHAR